MATVLLVVVAAAFWAPGAGAQSTPGQGPGGPVLVVTGPDLANPGQDFGGYYAEILKAEGLNEFAVRDKSSLNAATLAGYQVVVLASTSLTPTQVAALTTWVDNGGNLIAMRPDASLAGLLGLVPNAGADLSDEYLKIDTSAPPGAGITGQTMQFHGTADRWAANGAATVATLYSSASDATANPAVTLRQVGSSGGQAAAFTYDLARSVVYTRQGDPSSAGQELDGEPAAIRSDDMFFPEWLDFDKVAIPQADEQQRLLANLITQMNLDRTPLPRFWYLPGGKKAAVVLTGDDHNHGNRGTQGQFNTYEFEDSPDGCSVAAWECVRSTSYAFPATGITPEEAQAYQAAGFEIGLHLRVSGPNTGPEECNNFASRASLDADLTSQLQAFHAKWPGLDAPVTLRTHCIVWSDWASMPKVESEHGIRLDTNYYYWPGSWVQDRSGLFTGSGFPMRFADTDGSLIDVYQAATQLTDESQIQIDVHIEELLDRALGAEGYYGVFTANMHTDSQSNPGADLIITSAQAHGVPVVSAKQMLTWLDGRNDSSFGGVSFAGNVLHFDVDRADGAHDLQTMVPASSGTAQLTQVTRNGVPVSFALRTIKGIQYATFDSPSGAYAATYAGATSPPPGTPGGGDTGAGTGGGTTGGGDTGAGTGGGTTGGGDTGAGTGGGTTVGGDTGAGTGGGTTVGGGHTGTGSTGGSQTSAGTTTVTDRSGPRVTIVKRTVRASKSGLVTLRVACPHGELRCKVDLQLRHAARLLGRKTVTVTGGKAANVTVRLMRGDRLRLVRLRSLLVDVAASARDVGGNQATTTTRIRLLAPGRRRGSN